MTLILFKKREPLMLAVFCFWRKSLQSVINAICYVIKVFYYVMNAYVINAICYAIGRPRRECYFPALKIQLRCATSASYILLFSTTEKSAFTSGGYSSTIFCLHGRLFKRALNQDPAVKRVYTIHIFKSLFRNDAP